MTAPRFVSVELSFGRHDRRVELPRDVPAVIVGPNGSGKTTFVDGVLRTVFGFNRRQAGERALAEARRPWDGRPFRSTVRIATDEGALVWSRDHDSDEVRVEDEGGVILFCGIANPAAAGSEQRAYRALVESLFAAGDLAAYGRTAFVGQGRLLDTSFDSDLLRLGAGGHRRWRSACEDIEARHAELTREPVVATQRRRNRDRRLESLTRELTECQSALSTARSAGRRRTEAAERLVDVEREIDRLEEELAGLLARHTFLLERGRVEAERADARQRFDRLVELESDLERARSQVKQAESDRELAQANDRDRPDDLRRRVDELRVAWQAHDERVRDVAGLAPAAAAPIIEGGGRALLFLGAAVGLIGLIGWATGIAWGWAVAAAGGALVGAGALGTRTRALARRDARATLVEAERAADEALRNASDLSTALGETSPPDFGALARRIEATDRRVAAEDRLRAARERQAEVMRRVERAADAEERPGRSLAHLRADAGRRLTAIEQRIEELSDDAPTEAYGRELSERALQDRTSEVRAALAIRRGERDDLLLTRDRAERDAAGAGRLEARVMELTEEVREVEASVGALRQARDFLARGYERYRAGDEARLVDAVARRLAPLGNPSLAAFDAGQGLAGPSVELAGQRVTIDSPHLSHGQAHLVGLAIRLGAADFLACDGPAPPLLVEDPFVHLDDEHAARVWNLLKEISVDRQVIVTTRSAALLDRLGVRPSVRLGSQVSRSPRADRRVHETRSIAGAGDD